MANDYKGMLRSTLGLDPSLSYLVEDDGSSTRSTNSNSSNSSNSTSSHEDEDAYLQLTLKGISTLSTTSSSSNSDEDDPLTIKVQEPPTPKETTSPNSTATTVTDTSNQSHPSNPLPSPLLQEWQSRFQRATQQTPRPQQEPTKTPKSVRFASPTKLSTDTGSRLATPSPIRNQMTPPPTTPASYLSWIGGSSPNRSPMLLSPDHMQEISQRNRVLQSAWQEQKEQTRTQATTLEQLQKKHSPEPELDKKYRLLQVQHAQEMAELKRNHKSEVQAIQQQGQKKYDELDRKYSETKQQLLALQKSHQETCAELEWHHQVHKETKEELERNRQKYVDLNNKHEKAQQDAQVQIEQLQQRVRKADSAKKEKQALRRLDEARSQLQQIQQEFETFRQEASNKEKSAANTHNEMVNQLDNASSQIEKLQTELDDVRAKAIRKELEADARMKQVLIELDATKKQLNDQFYNKSVEELEAAHAQINQLQNDLDAMRSELSKERQNQQLYNKTVEELDDAHAQIEQMRSEIDVLRDGAVMIQVKEQLHDQTIDELQKVRALNDQLKRELDDLRKDVTNNKLNEQVYNKTSDELNKARAQIEQLQDELEDLRDEVAQNRWNEQVESKTLAQLEDANAQIGCLQSELDNIRKETGRKQESDEELYKEAIDQLGQARTEIEHLQEELNIVRTETTREESIKCDQNRTLNELEETRAEIEYLLEELENARQQAVELEEIQSDLTMELEEALQRNSDQARDLEQSQQRLHELQHLYKEATAKMNAAASQTRDMDDLQRKTADELERLNQENRNLHDAIQMHLTARQESQIRCETLERELKSNQTIMQQSPSVSSHVAHLQRNYGEELEQMQRQMMDATMQLDHGASNYSASSSLDWTLSRVETSDPKQDTVFFGSSPIKFIPDESELATLSPIVPVPVATPERNEHRDESLIDEVGFLDVAPPTPRIDDLIDELGVMNQERTLLLDQISKFHADDYVEDDDQKETTEESSTSMLDATIDLLQKMKDLITSPPPTTSPGGIVLDDKETSVLEQLEVLSEMMGYNDADDSLTLPLHKSLLSALEEKDEHSFSKEASQNDNLVNESTIVPVVDKADDSTSVWADLVAELRRHVAFLELDRDEVVRTTQAYVNEERRLENLKIEAATLRAHREGYEKAETKAKEHFQQLFAKQLCHVCQERIRGCQ